jgi:PiT family inorganic phosphate transporter
LSAPDREKLSDAKLMNTRLHARFESLAVVGDIPKEQRFLVRKDIMLMDRYLSDIGKKPEIRLSDQEMRSLKDELKNVRRVTDYSPDWVILMISLSLGLGTMIGWKRIVKTVGEKIGKEHLTYAQGASAELVAASTIGTCTLLRANPVKITRCSSAVPSPSWSLQNKMSGALPTNTPPL